jgi:hypothetical protein
MQEGIFILIVCYQIQHAPRGPDSTCPSRRRRPPTQAPSQTETAPIHSTLGGPGTSINIKSCNRRPQAIAPPMIPILPACIILSLPHGLFVASAGRGSPGCAGAVVRGWAAQLRAVVCFPGRSVCGSLCRFVGCCLPSSSHVAEGSARLCAKETGTSGSQMIPLWGQQLLVLSGYHV